MKGTDVIITFSELIQFVSMLCEVIALVIVVKNKKQRPLSGKQRRCLILHKVNMREFDTSV